MYTYLYMAIYKALIYLLTLLILWVGKWDIFRLPLALPSVSRCGKWWPPTVFLTTATSVLVKMFSYRWPLWRYDWVKCYPMRQHFDATRLVTYTWEPLISSLMKRIHEDRGLSSRRVAHQSPAICIIYRYIRFFSFSHL